jgi:hypothetical protein
MRDHVPDVVREALEATGLPWSLETGSKHTKIKLHGRLVGILNRTERDVGRGRKAQLNTVRQIKAAAREIELTK